MNTHETDFYSWTQEQASLLRQGRLGELDSANLMEEIEDMGRSERRELINRLAVLLAHLLKWQYQPERRSNSWKSTIKEQRRKVARVLRLNPGLKPDMADSLEDAYGDSVLIAARETGLDENAFPAECPWTVPQALDNEFWPDS